MKIDPPDRLADVAVALRPMRSDDAAPYAAAFRDDPDLDALVGAERDPDEESVRSRAEGQGRRAEEGRGVELAIADPATDAFRESVILHSFDWHSRRYEVGFWVVPVVRGRGVGSGAVAVALSWAFQDLDLLRVEMTTTPVAVVLFAHAATHSFATASLVLAASTAGGLLVVPAARARGQRDPNAARDLRRVRAHLRRARPRVSGIRSCPRLGCGRQGAAVGVRRRRLDRRVPVRVAGRAGSRRRISTRASVCSRRSDSPR